MEINDYLRALRDLTDSDLDEHILQRSDTEIRFERVRAPNGNWRHAQGSIVNAPGRTEQRDDSEATYRTALREFDRQMLSSRQFLPGFITDLRSAFGGNIAITCITAHQLDGNKPITARAVKVIIEHAKILRAERDSLPVEAKAEAAVDTRSTNTRLISSYLNNSMWAGVLHDGAHDPNDDRLPLAGKIGRLGKHAAQFVESMVIAACKEHPMYSQDCFELPYFLEIANIILEKYDDILRSPRMTPEILEATLAKANKDIATLGTHTAMAKLPVLAATTCLMCNLDPEVPDSLMSEAIARTTRHFRASPIPEIAITRIQKEFPARFKAAQTKSPDSRTSPPDQAHLATINHRTQIVDETLAYLDTINHGAQILDEMLSTFLELSLAIEASPDFTSRQKTTLSLWHGEGTLDDHLFADGTLISKKTKHALFNMLDAMDKDFPANLISEQLDALANTLIELTNASIQRRQGQERVMPVPDELIDHYLDIYCKTFIRTSVFGLHQEDARRLLNGLNGEIGEALDELLQQGPSLPATIYAQLIDACRQRADEIDDEWHATMEAELNDILTCDLLEEEQGGFGPLILPDGNAIGEKFYDMALNSMITLRWQDGRAILEPAEWKSLDAASKLEQLQACYSELIDSVFDGDAARATLFTQQVTAQVASLQQACERRVPRVRNASKAADDDTRSVGNRLRPGP